MTDFRSQSFLVVHICQENIQSVLNELTEDASTTYDGSLLQSLSILCENKFLRMLIHIGLVRLAYCNIRCTSITLQNDLMSEPWSRSYEYI